MHPYQSSGSSRNEMVFMHRINYLATLILGDAGKTNPQPDASGASVPPRALVTAFPLRVPMRFFGLSNAMIVMLDRSRQVKDMLKMFEVSDTTVMVLDRSDFALRNMDVIVKFLADEGRATRDASILPEEIRDWLRTPSQGHFLVAIVNRAKKMVTYRFSDDLIESLDTIAPVMEELSSNFLKNSTVSWAPLLIEPMNIIFIRWLYDKRLQEKMAKNI